jgi:hypothetical protein
MAAYDQRPLSHAVEGADHRGSADPPPTPTDIPPAPGPARFARVLAVLAVALLFWALRLRYWTTTFEVPFSDMADFERVARGLLRKGSFAFGPFWQSYKPPILPLLRATEILFFGEGLWPWRILQSTLVFVGVGWLAGEILLTTRRFALFWALALTVALSKSSIFWSLKVATEGVAEAFLYLSIAAILCALRRPTLVRAFAAGAILTMASLNRPNTMLALPLFLLTLFWDDWRRAGTAGSPRPTRLRRALRRPGICLLACALVWGPWLVRTHRLYGAFLPFNTSGALAFIYGVWTIEVPTDDGQWVTKSYPEILTTAPARFKNDYELDKWGRRAVRHWMARNWRTLFKLVPVRALETVADRDVQLTKVSRLQLYPPALNRLLLDKSLLAVAAGILGLCALPLVVDRRLFWLGLVSIPAWASTLPLQSNCRLLEPSLPIFLFGCVAWPYALLRIPGARRAVSAAGVWLPRLTAVYVPRTAAAIGLALTVFVVTAAQPAVAAGVAVAIQNPGFEQWSGENLPVGWTLAGGKGAVAPEPVRARAGRRCALVSEDNGLVDMYQDVPSPVDLEGKDFAVDLWVRSPNPRTAYLAVFDSRRWYFSERYSGSGEWQKMTAHGIAADHVESFRVHLMVDQGSACVDDAGVRLWAEPSAPPRELIVSSLQPDAEVYLFAIEDGAGGRIEFGGGRIVGRGEVYLHPDQGVHCVHLSGIASYHQALTAPGRIGLLFYRLPTGGVARVELGDLRRQVDLRTPVKAGDWTRVVLPPS